jgi:hypothetical protein
LIEKQRIDSVRQLFGTIRIVKRKRGPQCLRKITMCGDSRSDNRNTCKKEAEELVCQRNTPILDISRLANESNVLSDRQFLDQAFTMVATRRAHLSS